MTRKDFEKLQGDWTSESYIRYIMIPAEMRFEVYDCDSQ